MLKDVLYKIYRKMNRSRVVCTLGFAMYSLTVRCRNLHNAIQIPEQDKSTQEDKKDSPAQVKIAFVCDEMTYTNFSKECNAIFLTPYDWREKLEKFQPDLFFCESAWEGLKEYRGCWRGKIYRNHRVLFENRKVLLHILAYCKKKQIPTIFWNKEDPLFFDDPQYDFIDTALKFDYIYTTCQECIEEYKQRGHSNVELLMFGVSPKVYNPLGSVSKEKKAVFAGSWYADQEERCRDTERVFDMILRNGIELVIYDRNYGKNSFNTTYPEKYQKYIKPAVPYQELCDIIKHAEYAITINTIKDSKSMFARRAFEIVMCNTTLISNESKGLHETFEEGVWFVDQELGCNDALEIRRRNLDLVLKSHTNRARLKKICTDTNVIKNETSSSIALLYWGIDEESYREYRGIYAGAYALSGRFDGTQIHWDGKCAESQIEYYYCVKDVLNVERDCEVLVHHFEYLDKAVAIQKGKIPYTFLETPEWMNIVIRKEDIDMLIRTESIRIYCV